MATVTAGARLRYGEFFFFADFFFLGRAFPAEAFRGVGRSAVGGVECNLPGWRWATITKVALDRLSRSLHSDVCDSDGLRDAAIHSTISGRGSRRDRAASN